MPSLPNTSAGSFHRLASRALKQASVSMPFEVSGGSFHRLASRALKRLLLSCVDITRSGSFHRLASRALKQNPRGRGFRGGQFSHDAERFVASRWGWSPLSRRNGRQAQRRGRAAGGEGLSAASHCAKSCLRPHVLSTLKGRGQGAADSFHRLARFMVLGITRSRLQVLHSRAAHPLTPSPFHPLTLQVLRRTPSDVTPTRRSSRCG